MSPLYGDRFDSDGWPIPGDFFRRVDDIALWIGAELRARGIHVLQAKEKFGSVRVYLSAFTPDQHGAYREVCLEAIRRWPHYAKYILFGLGWGNLLGPVIGECRKKGETRRGEPIESEENEG